MRFKLIYFIAVICLLYSCSYKQQHLLFEQKVPNALTNTQPQAKPPVYRIKADDILQIKNLQNYKAFANDGSASVSAEGAPQTFQVEEDGKVTLPVIGHIPVAGLTRYEAAKKIEALYRDSSLKDPIIELKIVNLKVTILGEIKTQGNYTLTKETTTLVDIIGQAGGLTIAADEKTVRIIRNNNEGQKIIPVDLSNINVLNDSKIILQDNDVVVIAQNRRAVRDDKLQNFTTLIQPSVLIFNTALIIYSLFR